ncbi:uncharacterized protein V5649_003293 isoform 1-T1 [Rhynchonycteris naso]
MFVDRASSPMATWSRRNPSCPSKPMKTHRTKHFIQGGNNKKEKKVNLSRHIDLNIDFTMGQKSSLALEPSWSGEGGRGDCSAIHRHHPKLPACRLRGELGPAFPVSVPKGGSDCEQITEALFSRRRIRFRRFDCQLRCLAAPPIGTLTASKVQSSK